MNETSARSSRRAAWRFLGRCVRSQGRYVVWAVGSGLIWQAAAVAAPLFVRIGHALALDPRYHDSVDPGDLMSRAAIDAGFVRRAVDEMGHMSGFLRSPSGLAV